MIPQRSCHRCGRQVGNHERVGRRDTCLHCGADLHCCRNCHHHTPAAHNQCREPLSELQVDKEAGNFCEYFAFRQAAATAETADTTQQARDQLAALFTKKAG